MYFPPSVGIIGGYGPTTSAIFCQRLVHYALNLRPDYAPAFVMDSAPISFADAGKCIGGDIPATRTLVELANSGIHRLAGMGVRTIALPCNSVHVLFHEFARPDGVDLVHIADPLVRRLQKEGKRRVGFLASGMTASQDIYFSRLQAAKISYVLPSAEDQAQINDEITAFVATGHMRAGSKQLMETVLQHFAAAEVDAVALACTDIAGMLDRLEVIHTLPIVDSMDALAEECARKSIGL
jgi:aspartate racemase